MRSNTSEMTPRTSALVAGWGYVAIFVLAIFANFFVLGGIVESGSAVETAENITDSEGLFRAGLVAFTIVFVVDVPVAWALYVLFRSAGRELSLLTAWFRLVYTVFLGVAVIFFFVALQLLSGADYLSVFGAGQVDAHALIAIDAFNYAWVVGLACFGVHLILLGYLLNRTGWTVRPLGYVLMVAGGGLHRRHAGPRDHLRLRRRRGPLPRHRGGAVGDRGTVVHDLAAPSRRQGRRAASRLTTPSLRG